MPTFSVVIPTFRRSQLLAAVLPSYAAAAPDEIVVVDDGSGPPHEAALAEMIGRTPNARLVPLGRHRGLPAARNAGARATTSEWIVFGEDDVWFPPEYARTIIDHARDAGAAVVAGMLGLVHPDVLTSTPDAVNDRIRSSRAAIRDPERLVGLRWPVRRLACGDVETPLLQACAAVHRSVFDAVQFDLRFTGNAFREETDFFLSCWRSGIRTLHCPHAAVGHVKEHVRSTPGGAWANGRLRYALDMVRNNHRFLRKHRRVLAAVARGNGRRGGTATLEAAFVLDLLRHVSPARP